MSGTKRKHSSVSMEVKFDALKRIDSGENVNKIASELNVGRSTVLGWKNKRSEIESWCLKRVCTQSINQRKTMKCADFEKVSEALFQWFRLQRNNGVPISGPILQEKALSFFEKLKEDGEPSFTASNGWLNRWKTRYGIKQLSICGEKLSADSDNVSDFKVKFHDFIEKEGLSGDQIYNCDETGLNFRMLPTKSLALQSEKSAPGYKRSKERVTILACSNATGEHKLKLALIGKAKKPRAFKHVKSSPEGFDLPVWYRNQPNAWMQESIFKEWFFQQFVPAVEKYLSSKNLPRKAVLILDNATSHPDIQYIADKDIKAMYLPPNVTSLCQPMDQGVLESLKKRYRRKLLSSLISSMDMNNQDLISVLKKIDLLDVIGWIADSWKELEPMTLVRSWRKLLDHSGNEFSEDTQIESIDLIDVMKKVPGCEETSHNDVRIWMEEDGASEPLGDDEVVAAVKSKDLPNEIDSSDEDDEDIRDMISHSEGVKCFEGALRYLQQQEGSSAMDILFLRRLRDEAGRRRFNSEKQLPITRFFQPS